MNICSERGRGRECPRALGGAKMLVRGNENNSHKICSERGGGRECPRVPEGANMPVGVEGCGEGMLEGARPMSFGKGEEEKGAE